LAIYLITGAPGVGKSTVVSRVVLKLRSEGVIVGGFVTVERRVRGERVGFTLEDLTHGESCELASISATVGPRLGRYRVNVQNLSTVAVRSLTDAARLSELIVVDEVGPMELLSPELKRAVSFVSSSGKPILAVIHGRLKDDLLEALKSSAAYQEEVTLDNRESLPESLSSLLLDALRRSKAS
jgi:nucleoside-triphosphatase